MYLRNGMFSNGRYFSELEQHGIFAAAERRAQRTPHPCTECWEGDERLCEDCDPRGRMVEAYLDALRDAIEEIENASDGMKQHRVKKVRMFNWADRGWSCRDFDCEHRDLVEYDDDYGQPLGYAGCQRFTCKHACEQIEGNYGTDLIEGLNNSDKVLDEMEAINWDECPF